MKTNKFLALENNLAKGGLESIPLNQDSKIIAGYYLRAMRGRTELSEALGADILSENFVTRLEQIKIFLRKNELDEALEMLNSAVTQNELEVCEIILERSRYFLFKRDWQNVIDHSALALANSNTAIQSRMTFYQIRGLAFTQLRQYEQAIRELELSISISHILPRASSGFIAHTVLAQAYSYKGDPASAKRILDLVERILGQTENVDEWIDKKIQHLRSQYHFAKNFSDLDECRAPLTEALSLSQWTGLKVTEAMCTENLSELKLKPDDSVKHFVTWSYLPRLKLILHHSPKAAIRIENSEVVYKILNALCERPYKQADLFEKVWGMPYKEQYATHLRATLSKVRAKLPAKSLSVDDDVVSLL